MSPHDSSNQFSRCGQFRLEVEEIYVPYAGVVLRVPIRRCLLAERMVTLIARTEEGKLLADKLTLTSPAERVEERQIAASIRVAFGPDLEAIHALDCSQSRCKESCTPGYKSLLTQYGFSEDAEREIGEGCEGGPVQSTL